MTGSFNSVKTQFDEKTLPSEHIQTLKFGELTPNGFTNISLYNRNIPYLIEEIILLRSRNSEISVKRNISWKTADKKFYTDIQSLNYKPSAFSQQVTITINKFCCKSVSKRNWPVATLLGNRSPPKLNRYNLIYTDRFLKNIFTVLI